MLLTLMRSFMKCVSFAPSILNGHTRLVINSRNLLTLTVLELDVVLGRKTLFLLCLLEESPSDVFGFFLVGNLLNILEFGQLLPLA